MNHRFGFLGLLLICLLTAFTAHAFTELKGTVETTDKTVFYANSFRNLRFTFHCYYDNLERFLPIEEIASIKHTGSKNLGPNALFTSQPSVEKAQVFMRNGQILEVFMQPGYHVFQELIEGSEGKLYFTYHDTLSGKDQETSVHYEKIKMLTLQ